MYRILFVLFLLCIQSCLFASELIRYPNEQGSLQERLKWAFHAASAEKSFWAGYSVSRLMYPNETFMSGVSINGDFRFNKKPTLQEWIYGVKIEPSKDIKEAARTELERTEKNRVKVWREIGIFHKFEKGSKIPVRVKIMNLTIHSSFDGPLYWLGDSSHEESFAYHSGLYHEIRDPDRKEDLMAAIGIHPPSMAFPFLKNILMSNEPKEAQEAAAVFMGEMDTPEASRLLQQVIEKNPYDNVREAAVVGIAEMDTDEALQIMEDIARSHRDRELRETALAMLGDKQGARARKILEEIAWFDPDEDIRQTAVVMLGESEEGVPALLKIMEDHPSEDTREIAVHILAETVAGRQILKKKIKQ